MKIVEMEIRAFGRLEDVHFEFGEGVNVIHGLNESGKSTLLAFIRAMLFGLERGRGRASKDDAYTRFRPWANSGKYGGWLTLEIGGSQYRLYRDFMVSPKDLKVIQLESGVEVLDFPEQILQGAGMNESNFRNAMLLEADHGPVAADLAASLGDKLVHMATGGDRELAASRAIERLRLQRKQLEKSLPTERLAELERRFHQVKAWSEELDELQKAHRQAEELEARQKAEAAKASVEKPEEEAPAKKGKSGGLGLIFVMVIGLVLALLLWKWMKQWAIVVPVVLLALYAIWQSRKGTEQPRVVSKPSVEPAIPSAQEEVLIARGRRLARMEQLETSLDAEGSLWSEFMQTRQLMDRKKEEIQVLAAAESLIGQVATEVRQDFGAAFAKEMGKGLAEIVNGQESSNRRLYLDEGFQIRLEEGGQIQPLERFSRGTVDQMMLVMSLSAGKLLFREEMPLLLDDALTHYDEGRTQAALEYLCRVHPGQILLCSHSQREAECLEEAGIPYRYVDLNIALE